MVKISGPGRGLSTLSTHFGILVNGQREILIGQDRDRPLGAALSSLMTTWVGKSGTASWPTISNCSWEKYSQAAGMASRFWKSQGQKVNSDKWSSQEEEPAEELVQPSDQNMTGGPFGSRDRGGETGRR